MSLKSSQSQLNLSNGFKKRLLRPVSTHKQNDPKGSMRNSNLLSLHDHITIKNKYAEAKTILQSVQELLNEKNNNKVCNKTSVQSSLQRDISSSQKQQNTLGLQKLISVLKKKKQKQQSIKSEKSKTNTLSNSFKSIESILSETGAQNLQQGLKILYMQSQQIQQFLQQILYVLAITYNNTNFCNFCIRQNVDIDMTINQNQQKPLMIAKSLAYLLQSLKYEHNQVKDITLSDGGREQFHRPKFKPILNYEDLQKNNQLDFLRQELKKYKNINNELQTKLKSLTNKSSQQTYYNKHQPTSINQIQTIHKQIKQIYEQSLSTKDQLIQKLKSQLLYTQQHKSSSKQSSLSTTQSNQRQSLIINNNQSNDNTTDRQYLSTIQQQFQKMRHGFNKKLQSLQKQNNQKQLKLKKQLFNLQKQLQNANRQKNIIYKKYQFLLNQA